MSRTPGLLRTWSLAAGMLLVCGAVAWTQDLGSLPNFSGKKKAGPPAPAGTLTLAFEPATAQPGDEVVLKITATLGEGTWIYSTNREFGGATKFNLTGAGLEPLGDFEADQKPKTKFEPVLGETLEKFYKQVVWTRRYRVAADAPAQVMLKGLVDYQICNEGHCLPEKEDREVTLAVAGGVSPAANPAAWTLETRPGRKDKPALVRISLDPPLPEPGAEATLRVTFEIADDWHIYAMQQLKEGLTLEPTEIDVTEFAGFEPIDAAFTPDHEPTRHDQMVDELETHLIYEHGVTWSRKFRALPDVPVAERKLAGEVRFQICWKSCIPMKVPFVLPAATAAAAPPPGEAPPTPFVQTEPGVGPIAAAPEGPASPTPAGSVSQAERGSVWVVLLTAFAAGFAALATPCVFPMVPITVSIFLKQSERKDHRPYKMALVYCGTIVGSFTVLGLGMSALFGAGASTALANSWGLNLVFAGVMLFFAMNLLGAFEIAVPSGLLNWANNKATTGGYFGVIFMAITFTLTSFTCTFAFLGTVLVWAANGEFWWPLICLIAFSTAFASPFFVLALFPSLLQKLPKSGGWMNRVKVVMGLIELAFFFKFVSVADVSYFGQPWLFDYHLVLSSWVILAFVTGAYLFGLLRFPHDLPHEHTGAGRAVVAMSFFALAVYMTAGLFGARPEGAVWSNIAAFAPPRFDVESPILVGGGGGEKYDGPVIVGEHDHLAYHLDFERAFAQAQAENLPLFIDFTGVNCVNCRLNEKEMGDPKIRQLLAKLMRTRVYTDVIPSVADRELAARMLAANRDLQSNWFGDNTLPSYLITTPDRKKVLATLNGQKSRNELAEFVAKGLAEWNRVNSGVAAAATAPLFPDAPMLIGETDGLAYHLDYDKAFAEARLQNRPLLIEFTGVNSINTRLTSIELERHPELLGQLVRARLYVDMVPGVVANREEAKRLQQANAKLHEEWYGDVTLPAVIIVTPDRKTVLSSDRGLLSDTEVVNFLQTGLSRWSQLQTAQRQFAAPARVAAMGD